MFTLMFQLLIGCTLYMRFCASSPVSQASIVSNTANLNVSKDAPQKIPGTDLLLDVTFNLPPTLMEDGIHFLEQWARELSWTPWDIITTKVSKTEPHDAAQAWIEPEWEHEGDPLTNLIASKALSVLVDLMNRKGGGQEARLVFIDERGQNAVARGAVRQFYPGFSVGSHNETSIFS